ncbi:MAG: ferritin [Andreesenia angusta]|nr:ferritin [Andreesenia angusta]
MISKKLSDALNEQMNYEFASAHYYLGMAGYCSDQGLDGFANFFQQQYEEELFHAKKLYNFIVDMDLRVIVDGLPAPENYFDSPLAVFESALEHEQSVTSRIYNLMDIATSEKEYATISFLQWYVDEQIEEEANMKDKITRLERIQGDCNALYLMDAELAQRVFDDSNGSGE